MVLVWLWVTNHEVALRRNRTRYSEVTSCLSLMRKRVQMKSTMVEEALMAAERGTGGNTGGIGLGGILVIVGIILMIVWSFWVGLIVTLVGLIAFGGFAKGKWY